METPKVIQDKHAISVVLWGGNNPQDPLADPAGHMALAVHADISQPVTCHLHHARCPDQVRFIYESRPSQRFAADPAPRGRCELRGGLSADDARAANEVLARFGADEAWLPFYGEGNCHNWTAAAVRALESAGLAESGDGAAWEALIGRGPRAMQRSWVEERGGGILSSGTGNATSIKDRVNVLQKLLGGESR
ncbi:hypothetical protein B0I35DRAFT_482630 [Stachybotrys elegans]|uniref:Uncharacterized protein n=1 Tax=Stachybotrys elegans TaxID=80388 RepID=A0A8K0SHH9_9HYPO|nr:hypothetical protein B0I35DRAFT_482630 [Stachybotrys elegans]